MADKQKFVWNQWQLLAKLGFRGKGLQVFPLILGSGGGRRGDFQGLGTCRCVVKPVDGVVTRIVAVSAASSHPGEPAADRRAGSWARPPPCARSHAFRSLSPVPVHSAVQTGRHQLELRLFLCIKFASPDKAKRAHFLSP